MGRHNRVAEGEDQHGRQYTVDYPPDWLQQVKVTQEQANGRQSTKTLYHNPDPPANPPASRVRTRLTAPEIGLDLELLTDDPRLVIRRITVEAVIPQGREAGEKIQFSIVPRRFNTRAR